MNALTEEKTANTIGSNEETVHLERLDDGAIAVLTLDDPKRAKCDEPRNG
jgi:hypothetical protein